MTKEDSCYKKQAIKAAEDLRYGKKIVEQIKVAKSVNTIARIMTSARKGENNAKL